MTAPQIYESLVEFRDDDEEVQRRLAYWLETYWPAYSASASASPAA